MVSGLQEISPWMRVQFCSDILNNMFQLNITITLAMSEGGVYRQRQRRTMLEQRYRYRPPIPLTQYLVVKLDV